MGARRPKPLELGHRIALIQSFALLRHLLRDPEATQAVSENERGFCIQKNVAVVRRSRKQLPPPPGQAEPARQFPASTAFSMKSEWLWWVFGRTVDLSQ